MRKNIISISDNADNMMCIAWLLFFLCKAAFTRYVGRTEMVCMISIVTIIYFVFSMYSQSDVIIGGLFAPKCTLLMLPFFIYAFTSIRWATEVSSDTYMVNSDLKFNIFLLFLLEIYFGNKKKIMQLLNIYCLAMFIFGLIVTFTTPVASWGSEYTYGGITEIHRNTASMIFVICFGISYYLYQIYKEKRYLLLLIGFFFFNIVTGSRKGILQTLLIIFLIVIMQKDIKIKIRSIVTICSMAILVVVIFMYSPFLQQTYGERLLAIFDNSIYDGSKVTRAMYRTWAFEGFLERPLTGNGTAYTNIIILKNAGYSVYSHCNYTEMLCNYGIIGFGLYYLIYMVCIIKGLVTKGNLLAEMALILIFSVLLIEYGQVTYEIMNTVIPLYVLFLTSMYSRIYE